MTSLLERYDEKINGVLSCWDRVIIQGTIPNFCYSAGMTSYLYEHDIRIFDYPKFAEPLRDQIRHNAEQLAENNGLSIEFIRKSSESKEKHIQDIIKKRGNHPGLVAILSAMEKCPSYYPWHDKTSHKTYLRPKDGKCLHFYFYFIDEIYGLCYLRVPTWCPFRLQFYFNGHNWLASKLDRLGIGYKLVDNAFAKIDDWNKAQLLMEKFSTRKLHTALDQFARMYCPVVHELKLKYRWSIMQVEYATDIVFLRQQDLASLYDEITRTAIHSVKASNVATFLGRKLTGNYQDEVGNDFSTRIEGTRIRHTMGPVSIKMYDKFSLILRIETTTNNLSFFKHHRRVEKRDGTSVYKLASLKKSIYSLHDLSGLLHAANYRYIDFISELDVPSAGNKELTKISAPCIQNDRSYKGFNFFSTEDQHLFEVIFRGEYFISGLRNSDLKQHLDGYSSSRISRLLKRLRVHGLIKRVGRTYKYYVTALGRRTIITGLKLKQTFILPALANS